MNTYTISITSLFRGETVTTVFDTNAESIEAASIDAAFCARRVAVAVDEVVAVSVVKSEPIALVAIALPA